MTSECPIRANAFGYACTRCKAQWDRDDDAPPCPRQAPPVIREPDRLPFASGLPFN